MEKTAELKPRPLNTQTPLAAGATLIVIGNDEYQPIAEELAAGYRKGGGNRGRGDGAYCHDRRRKR
jgi:hypothetical protein